MAMGYWWYGAGAPFLEGTVKASSLSPKWMGSSRVQFSCPSGAAGTGCDSA